MKRMSIKFTAILLCIVIALCALLGCSSTGKTLMELDGQKISVNTYKFYLSRMKGVLCSTYAFGEEAVSDSFWDIIMAESGTTYNEYYTKSVLDNTKTYLAAMYEFERRGLKLSKETLNEIDEKIDELIEYDANGSKTKFNSLLSAYGANIDVLREVYIIEAKIALLRQNMFYDENGNWQVSDALVNDYYEDNYVRFKQIYLPTYEYVYYTDANGDDIYYTKDGKIAYDTNATAKKDANGKAVLDENGKQVYVKTDADGNEIIAYDTTNGTRKNKKDENGNSIVTAVDDQTLQGILDTAAQLYSKAENGEDFDILADKDHPNGIYLTKTSGYDSKVTDAVFDMEVGELRIVQGEEEGIYIIKKYELEEKGYDKNENSDFFIRTSNGRYMFAEDMENIILAQSLEDHKDSIIVDESLLKGVDIKSVGVNTFY